MTRNSTNRIVDINEMATYRYDSAWVPCWSMLAIMFLRAITNWLLILLRFCYRYRGTA